MEQNNKVICLMGPTAAGKTDLAIKLSECYPIDIISVDSAMIYRGMDIGTGKPSREELSIAPHQLIDICDPKESYSAASFCEDALSAIAVSVQNNRIPVLVGGTMMYFRALQQGLSDLPSRDEPLREKLSQEAMQLGWEAMHQRLMQLDPVAGTRIHPNDPQRILRALEVIEKSGHSLTSHFEEPKVFHSEWKFINVAIAPDERATLHARIKSRFHRMLETGFIEEVEQLYSHSDLSDALPAIRSVGYRQIWQHLQGHYNRNEMIERALAATRQLAKRQLTWLRSWDELNWLNSSLPLEQLFTEMTKVFENGTTN